MVPQIVETRVLSRTTTSIPFYRYTAEAAAHIYSGTLLDNGSYSETAVLSDNDLTLTITQTYNNLTTYSAVMSTQVDFYPKFSAYHLDNNISIVTFAHSGINVPFTITSTYNFTTDVNKKSDVDNAISELVSIFNNSENLDFAKLVSVNADTNSVTTVYKYDNSSDYAPLARWQFGIDQLVTYPSIYINRSIAVAFV